MSVLQEMRHMVATGDYSEKTKMYFEEYVKLILQDIDNSPDPDSRVAKALGIAYCNQVIREAADNAIQQKSS